MTSPTPQTALEKVDAATSLVKNSSKRELMPPSESAPAAEEPTDNFWRSSFWGLVIAVTMAAAGLLARRWT
jgi:hypothetical protein